jgi:hypothetical protein
MNAHSHGLNNHTHSFTPSGKVSSTFTGTAVTSGGMSAHSTGWFQVMPSSGSRDQGDTVADGTTFTKGNLVSFTADFDTDNHRSSRRINMNIAHTHSVTAKGTVSSIFVGQRGTVSSNSENTTSVTSTGSFTGSNGYTSSTGGGSSFSILPPYLVKYCWERTA